MGIMISCRFNFSFTSFILAAHPDNKLEALLELKFSGEDSPTHTIAPAWSSFALMLASACSKWNTWMVLLVHNENTSVSSSLINRFSNASKWFLSHPQFSKLLLTLRLTVAAVAIGLLSHN
jgi:hypothetical protein